MIGWTVGRDTYALILFPSHLTTFGGLKQIIPKISQKDYMHSSLEGNRPCMNIHLGWFGFFFFDLRSDEAIQN